jgi:hypothetical protein
MKTHYRNVFKSDHLGVADLEDFIERKESMVYTIKEVIQHFDIKVAGRTGNHNIAYFVEGIKPLVLNATNSKVVKSFNSGSPFVQDWSNTKIELYIDATVKMKGDIVGGVRIKPVPPQSKKKPLFTESNFDKAHVAKATVEIIKKAYTLTPEMEAKYLVYVTKN